MITTTHDAKKATSIRKSVHPRSLYWAKSWAGGSLGLVAQQNPQHMVAISASGRAPVRSGAKADKREQSQQSARRSRSGGLKVSQDENKGNTDADAHVRDRQSQSGFFTGKPNEQFNDLCSTIERVTIA